MADKRSRGHGPRTTEKAWHAQWVDPAALRDVLHRLYIGDSRAELREEDRKKVAEMVGFLDEIARVGRRRLVVDAAAGKATVGLAAAEVVGVGKLIVLERDPARAAAARAAAARVASPVEVREGDVADAALWPKEPDLVVALHACGPASDAILERAVAARARHILLAPCCYSSAVTFAPAATALAKRLGADEGEVCRRVVEALVDVERTLRLEAAGYVTVVAPFVAPTVTPHHLLWRARRVGEPVRMRRAAEKLARLREAAP